MPSFDLDAERHEAGEIQAADFKRLLTAEGVEDSSPNILLRDPSLHADPHHVTPSEEMHLRDLGNTAVMPRPAEAFPAT